MSKPTARERLMVRVRAEIRLRDAAVAYGSAYYFGGNAEPLREEFEAAALAFAKTRPRKRAVPSVT